MKQKGLCWGPGGALLPTFPAPPPKGKQWWKVVEAGVGLPGIPMAPPRKAAFKCALGGQCQIRTPPHPLPGLPARNPTNQTKVIQTRGGEGGGDGDVGWGAVGKSSAFKGRFAIPPHFSLIRGLQAAQFPLQQGQAGKVGGWRGENTPRKF